MIKNTCDKNLIIVSRNELMNAALTIYKNHYPKDIKDVFGKIVYAISDYEVKNEEVIDVILIKEENFSKECKDCILKYTNQDDFMETDEKNILLYEKGKMIRYNFNEFSYKLK